MAEELQQPAPSQAEPQAPVTPEHRTEPSGAVPEPVQPEPDKGPEMVPVTDLRALQSVKDREVTAAERRAQAAEAQLAALKATMDTDISDLARATMEPDEAQQFIAQRQSHRQYTDTQQAAYDGQKLKTIVGLVEKFDIPLSEFSGVRADPRAQVPDAYAVVTAYLEKMARETAATVAKRKAEAQTLAQQGERQIRREAGDDKIGSVAEPAASSPALKAQFEKERLDILTRSNASRGRGDFSGQLIACKNKYRELGLDI